jgi:iron complex transport system substrate-binding protein
MIRMPRRFAFMAVTVAGAVACGCGGPQSSSTTRPASPARPTSGPAVELRDWVRQPDVAPDERERPSLRIVSTAPNVTEIVCALGLRENLVGRTQFCTWPPEIADVRSIGALIDMSDELLIGLKPDIVLVSGKSRSIVERLEARRIRYESIPDVTLEDVFEAIRRMGRIVGRPKTAERLCAGIHRELEAVTKRYLATKPARVLFLTDVLTDPPRPPFVAGPGSFYHDLIRRAGYENAVTSEGGSFAPLSLEAILHANPDVILELDPDGSRRGSDPNQTLALWRRIGALRAVESRRVYVITGGQHYLLGPRIAATYLAMCQRIADETP